MYIYIYLCMCVRVCVHYVYVCIYVCMYIRMCVRVYVYIGILLEPRSSVHAHAHVRRGDGGLSQSNRTQARLFKSLLSPRHCSLPGRPVTLSIHISAYALCFSLLVLLALLPGRPVALSIHISADALCFSLRTRHALRESITRLFKRLLSPRHCSLPGRPVQANKKKKGLKLLVIIIIRPSATSNDNNNALSC